MKEHVHKIDLDKVQLLYCLTNLEKRVNEYENSEERKADRCCFKKVIDLSSLS